MWSSSATVRKPSSDAELGHGLPARHEHERAFECVGGVVQAGELEQAQARAADFGVDHEQLGSAAGHQLEQLEGAVHVVEQAEAQHHVELLLQLELEHVALDEAIAPALDPLRLEHELRLRQVGSAPVHAEHEVGAGVGGEQRPVAGVAAEVEDPAPAQRAPGEGEERLEEVAAALLVAIDQAAIVGGRRHAALELEAVAPAGKCGDPLFELTCVHRVPFPGCLVAAAERSRTGGSPLSLAKRAAER